MSSSFARAHQLLSLSPLNQSPPKLLPIEELQRAARAGDHWLIKRQLPHCDVERILAIFHEIDQSTADEFLPLINISVYRPLFDRLLPAIGRNMTSGDQTGPFFFISNRLTTGPEEVELYPDNRHIGIIRLLRLLMSQGYELTKEHQALFITLCAYSDVTVVDAFISSASLPLEQLRRGLNQAILRGNSIHQRDIIERLLQTNVDNCYIPQRDLGDYLQGCPDLIDDIEQRCY